MRARNLLSSKLLKKSNNFDLQNALLKVPIEMAINLLLDKIPFDDLSMGQRAIVLLQIILAYDDKPLLEKKENRASGRLLCRVLKRWLFFCTSCVGLRSLGLLSLALKVLGLLGILELGLAHLRMLLLHRLRLQRLFQICRCRTL